MATGQTILDTMELLNQELQLQSGEADVARALVAINRAIDYLEAELAKHPDVLGDTTGDVTTTANTESTAFPSTLLRLDRMQLLGDDSLPLWDLTPHGRTGGHRTGGGWPFTLAVSGSTGKPSHYWTDGRKIYWDPLPDDTHTVRWYGLGTAGDMVAATTFAFPDIAILPIASFATNLMNIGVGDGVSEVGQLASATFHSLIETLSDFNRDGASGFEYERIHNT